MTSYKYMYYEVRSCVVVMLDIVSSKWFVSKTLAAAKIILQIRAKIIL